MVKPPYHHAGNSFTCERTCLILEQPQDLYYHSHQIWLAIPVLDHINTTWLKYNTFQEIFIQLLPCCVLFVMYRSIASLCHDTCCWKTQGKFLRTYKLVGQGYQSCWPDIYESWIPYFGKHITARSQWRHQDWFHYTSQVTMWRNPCPCLQKQYAISLFPHEVWLRNTLQGWFEACAQPKRDVVTK